MKSATSLSLELNTTMLHLNRSNAAQKAENDVNDFIVDAILISELRQHRPQISIFDQIGDMSRN